MGSMVYGVIMCRLNQRGFAVARVLFSPNKAASVRFFGPVHVSDDLPLVPLLGESPICYLGPGSLCSCCFSFV
jgi:hypothetical protein